MNIELSGRVSARPILLAMIGTLAVSASFNLEAQSQARDAIEEIVVTARQRAESIMDVPASVTAFSQLEIENAAISRPAEFLMRTPGVSQVQTLEVGDMQVNIRGINSGRDTESSVALVVDGVLQTNPNALNQELDDIVQIEVLKGPQGAIYGRNALAGAIILTTAKPTDELSIDLSGTIGSYNLKKAGFGIGGPVGGIGEAKLRLYYRDDDGSFRNSFQNCKDCMNFMEEYGGVFRLITRPSDSTEVDFKLRYSEVKAGGLAFNASLALVDAAAAGFDPLFYADANEHDFVHINRNRPDNQQTTVNVSARSITDLGDIGDLIFTATYNNAENYFLGAGTSNAFGIYNANEVCQQEYAAGAATITLPRPFFWAPNIGDSFLPPYPPITCGGYQYQQRDQRDYSAEIRLESSQDQPLRWMTGAYFADIDRRLVVAYGGDLGLDRFEKGFVTSAGPNPTDLLYDDNLLSKVYAVFGNIDYDITDTIEVSAAIRYDRESRKVNNNVPKVAPQTPGFGAFGFPVCPDGPDDCTYFINPFYNVNPDLDAIPSRSATFSHFQPKFTLNWRPNEQVTTFVSYGIGFRSGGFNSTGTTATLQQFFGGLQLADGTNNLNNLRDEFDKEISKALEIGFKSRLLSNSLQLNGAVYFTETENMQDFSFFAGPFGSLRVVTNIDRGQVFGAELDTRWRATQNLSLHAGIGYTDSEIKKYTTRPYTVGNKLPYVPQSTAMAGIELSLPVGPTGWDVIARTDTMYVGPTWFSPVQRNYLPNFFSAFGFGGGEFSLQQRKGFSTTDVTVTASDDVWTAQLWAKNIFDKRYLEEVIPAPEFGGSFIHETFGRTFGITVTRAFGAQ